MEIRCVHKLLEWRNLSLNLATLTTGAKAPSLPPPKDSKSIRIHTKNVFGLVERLHRKVYPV